MTAPGPRRAPIGSGLLEKLIAVVRPEFRVEVYLVDPDDPVLGRRQCAVADCDRPVSENGLALGPWSTVARPQPASARGVPRRSRSRVEWPPGSERLHGDRMSIRQQRRRVVHATSHSVVPCRPTGSGHLVGPGGNARSTGSQTMWAALLHRVDRERQDPVLQVSYHPVGPARPPRRRRIPRALPAARHRAHRLPLTSGSFRP